MVPSGNCSPPPGVATWRRPGESEEHSMIRRLREFWHGAVNGVVSPPFVALFGGLWLRLHGRGGSRTGPVDLRKVRSLAVVRYDGLGDLAVTTAFLRELRRSLPDVRITLVVREEWVDLMRECPHVNDLLGFSLLNYPKYTPIYRLLAVARFCRTELWSRGVEAVLVAQSHSAYYQPANFAFLSGAPIRIGRRAPEVRDATTGKPVVDPGWRLLTRVDEDTATGHEVEMLSSWLIRLGLSSQDQRLQLHWDAAASAEAARRLGPPVSGGLTVALGIGASHSFKVWPLDRFIEVTRRLRQLNARVVLIGASDLQAAADQLAATVGDGVLNLVGPMRLQETAAVLARCDLYIGNDSGPMHLAAAAGIPVVEVVGWPSDTPAEMAGSPLRIGPWCPHRRIVQPAGNGCDWTVRVDVIEVDAVWAAVLSLLEEIRVASRR